MIQTTNCPEVESLAALIDGQIRGADRERLLVHIDECPDCYTIFAEGAKFKSESADEEDEEAFVPPAPLWTQRKWQAGAGLAAAALVVIVVSRLIPGGGGDALPATTELVQGLATPEEAGQLMVSLETLPAFPSFNSNSNADSVAFRAGVHLVDLEVARLADDALRVDRILRDFERFLERNARFPELVGSLKRTRQSLDDATSIRAAIDVGALEAAFVRVSDSESLYLDFGKWTESGRLAASVQRDVFLRQALIRGFLEVIRKENLEAPVRDQLERLDRLLGQDLEDLATLSDLEKGFGDIIQLMTAAR